MGTGKFITLEGGEGAGKSTQAERLSDRLVQQGFDVVLTREPGGSPFAEHLRAVLLNPETPAHSSLSEALLFYAARADHLETKIRPALASGRWVICDRFSDSTRAYQGAAGTLAPATLDALDAAVVAPTYPDLTLMIDIDPRLGMQRADERRQTSASGQPTGDRDRFESRVLAFHEALRQGFLDIAKAEPKRCAIVDGNRSPDAIADDIWHIVSERAVMTERA